MGRPDETPDEWAKYEQAISLVRDRLNASTGKATAMLADACASGAIRTGRVLVMVGEIDGEMARFWELVDRSAWQVDVAATGAPAKWINAEDLKHWLSEVAPAKPGPGKPRPQVKQDGVRIALDALYPHGVPGLAKKDNPRLCSEVAAYLKAHNMMVPSDMTIRRAAGRS